MTGTGFFGPATVLFGGTATTFTMDSPSQITALAPPGTGTVQVTVVTPDGVSNGFPYTYAGVPSLSGVSPNQGPLSGGNTVTLTGTNLTGATAVRFGTAAAASFTVVSATQITATAPAAAAGTVQVTVTTPGGTSNGVSYTYLMAPTLTGLSPNQGPTTGGDTVTITGTNLAQTTTVLFATTPAAFTVISNSQIVTNTPQGAAGPTNVTVTAPGGTSPAAIYTRVAPPNI